MRIGKSSNPALSLKRFENLATADYAGSEVMTVNGTVNKTALMFLIVLVTASLTWSMSGSLGYYFMIGGAVAGLILALITIFKPDASPITAPLYAAAEGLALGAISSFYAALYDGIVFKAVGLTFGVLAIVLILYKSGTIKATPKFKRGMMAAMGGILLFYLLSFVSSLFGAPFSLGNLGLVGIGIQLVIVIVASLSLILDFDMIETAAENNLPKYMEWYGAFSIMLTLVWLYLELLRLLALISGRD